MKAVIFLFISLSTLAASFKQINNFRDPNCPNWTIERFDELDETFYFGVMDAKKYGYTYGFPISRTAVDAVWCALEKERGYSNKACNNSGVSLDSDRPFKSYAGKAPFESEIDVSYYDQETQLNAYLKYVRRVSKAEKIKRPNVGAVLELLSRLYLQELSDIYPKSSYKIASGVEYKKSANSRTIGELDIIVYNQFTCQVIALGESKASSSRNQRRSLRKAKEQIGRFLNFLHSN